MHPRRALIVGAWTWLDPTLPDRPGIAPVLRQLAHRLQAAGWTVRALLDDSPTDTTRPLSANLLDGLAWLSETAEPLLILSGVLRDGCLLTRDTRAHRLTRTAVPLTEIDHELPAGCGLITDLPIPASSLPTARWAIGAGQNPTAAQGASLFLTALVHALAAGGPITAASLAAQLAPLGAWARGSLTTEILPPMDPAPHRTCTTCGAPILDASAAFCPSCGASLASGNTLDGGRYRLIRRLGEGGMGQVFLAEDTRLKVQRAIKLISLPPELPDAEVASMRARMIQEARAAQVLGEHTHHVVRVFDVGHCAERDEPFLVMELLEGETLTERLARGPIPLDEARGLALTMAETLAIAHTHNLIHRDLKPDNIMLITRGGEPFLKVLDFGLVKMEHAEVDTQSGRMMGTLQYMPPEQLKGEHIDARADVFALGAVFYECFSGHRANPGTTPLDVFAVLLDRGVIPLREVAPTLPDALCTLVDRCLALDRRHRPEHAGVIAEALSPKPNQPVTVDAEPITHPRRPRWPWLMGALTLSLGAGAMLMPPEGTPPSDAGLRDAGQRIDVGQRTDATTQPIDASPQQDAAAQPRDATLEWTRPTTYPAQPQSPRQTEGTRQHYRGEPAHRFAQLTIDATLGEDAPAQARWAALPIATRRWLSQRVPTDALTHGPQLSIPLDVLRAQQQRRPKSRRIRNLGTMLTADGASPIFLRVRCGRAQPGDLLFTAKWSTPGYGDGRCRGTRCPGSLARALKKASTVMEALRLDLVLTRGGGEDEETSERVVARCVVAP